MATVTIEKRKRGFFGWLVTIMFLIFNAFMIVSIATASSNTGAMIKAAHSDAERTGATVGAGLGITVLVFFWFLGAAILGIAMLFTRGKKIIITEERT